MIKIMILQDSLKGKMIKQLKIKRMKNKIKVKIIKTLAILTQKVQDLAIMFSEKLWEKEHLEKLNLLFIV
jgi:hypothetical protein